MPKIVAAAVLSLLLSAPPAQAEIELLAIGTIPGTATDKSNLTEILPEGTPDNRLGGFGSAIAYIEGSRFLLLPDRGPRDGASTYQCRFQIADLTIAGKKIDLNLIETVILRGPDGRPYL